MNKMTPFIKEIKDDLDEAVRMVDRLQESHDALIGEATGLHSMVETLTTEVHFHRTTKSALIAAAKALVERSTHETYSAMRAAIAAAEEPSSETAARDFMNKNPQATTATKELAPDPEPKWITRLYDDRDALLDTAKEALQLITLICEDEHEVKNSLRAAIAKAEETRR